MSNNLQAKKLKSYFLHLTRGFTVVELLVVIGIIAIMSVIVMGSISDSKKRGRDSKRIADIRVLQLALENYYSVEGKYPTTLSGLGDSNLPTDPNGPSYKYAALNGCQSYHLGATLELQNGILDDDEDYNSGSETVCGGAGFEGDVSLVYDVIPKY